ncbi:MAG TPA: protein-L-isoaspartate(D-aspartate) O-methyltransferase [Dissulfurispiraceae bacterium]|nr:protein-L-isoaspartate(D-aspartate) O-methyltransferase [Dissulfurispiraceae bacterium]
MMDNSEHLRHLMVTEQLIPRGIRDERVLNAMRAVPRHLFMPASSRSSAYDDMALPIGEGQTISQPYMVAAMTELLMLAGNERVLEIGTGSGYQAAVLSMLSREVMTVERIPELAERAGRVLADLGYANVTVLTADGTLGAPSLAPFDRILVTAAAPDVPQPLIDQLAEKGILVAPVGSRISQQLVQIIRRGNDLHKNYKTHCIFVPLIGRHGWSS